MTGQVAAGELRQGLMSIYRGGRVAEPGRCVYETVLPVAERAADHRVAKRGGEEGVHQGLSGGGDSGGIQRHSQLGPGAGAVGGQLIHDHFYAPVC